VSEWILFSVLCLHDFDSNDPDHLSFHKNEILHIVKQEETGWWAAVRENGTQVGWIPSAFVAELEGVELEKLQKVRFDLRVYEYDAERLYNSAPISQLHHLYPVSGRFASSETPGEASTVSAEPDSQYLIAPLCIQGSSMLLATPTDLIPEELPGLKGSGELDSHFTVGGIDSPASARFRVPPSPSTPIPRPPLTTAPLLINKPTPPTPVRSSSTSALDTGRPNQDIGRSRSETASGALSGRNLRRRPVLVDDRVSLSRLSTLMETNNMTEVEILTSPQMSGSFDAFSRVTGGASGEAPQPFAHDRFTQGRSRRPRQSRHITGFGRKANCCPSR
jgi:son of sevenless-like protein